MAEYWKSTGKKYCDFCKCWTADNKASIDFHEKGKNHQANVKRKLGEIKKNSIAKRKKDEASDRMFDQMEKAALAAVQKDINTAGTQVGRSDLKNIVSANSADKTTVKQSETYPWTAMTAPQGFTYYYNALTGESSWTMPEIFKKIQEQQRKDKEIEEDKKKGKSTVVDRSSQKTNTSDPYRKPPEKPVITNIHPLLGGWSTVQRFDEENEETEETSEASNKEEISRTVSPSTTCTDPEHVNNDKQNSEEQERTSGKKFKEKVIKTNIISNDEPVAFKKRKTKVRNVRKRDGDD